MGFPCIRRGRSHLREDSAAIYPGLARRSSDGPPERPLVALRGLSRRGRGRAALGVLVFHAYLSITNRHLVWRAWVLPFMPGFGGCVAGGGCGVSALAGRGCQRGLTTSLTVTTLIDLIILGTAWVGSLRIDENPL